MSEKVRTRQELWNKQWILHYLPFCSFTCVPVSVYYSLMKAVVGCRNVWITVSVFWLAQWIDRYDRQLHYGCSMACGENNAVAMANGLTHRQWPVMHPIRTMTTPNSSRATTDATMVPTCSRNQLDPEWGWVLLLVVLCWRSESSTVHSGTLSIHTVSLTVE